MADVFQPWIKVNGFYINAQEISSIVGATDKSRFPAQINLRGSDRPLPLTLETYEKVSRAMEVLHNRGLLFIVDAEKLDEQKKPES